MISFLTEQKAGDEIVHSVGVTRTALTNRKANLQISSSHRFESFQFLPIDHEERNPANEPLLASLSLCSLQRCVTTLATGTALMWPRKSSTARNHDFWSGYPGSGKKIKDIKVYNGPDHGQSRSTRVTLVQGNE
jgi:hypothetical protein